jgi:hypothetical protein
VKRGPVTGTLSLLCCFNHLSSASSTSLASAFRNRFILDPFCSTALIILVLFFQILWMVKLTRSNSWHASAFFFPFPISRISLAFLWHSKPIFYSWL